MSEETINSNLGYRPASDHRAADKVSHQLVNKMGVSSKVSRGALSKDTKDAFQPEGPGTNISGPTWFPQTIGCLFLTRLDRLSKSSEGRVLVKLSTPGALSKSLELFQKAKHQTTLPSKS